MILAEDELGIGTDHAGIIVLDDGAAGRARRWPTCCRSRPTCSSSRSRRTGPTAWASTASRARCTPPPARRSRRRRGRDDPGVDGRRTIGRRDRVEAPDLCPRFTARAFEDVTIGPSPPWLKARLMAAGQRPINNVVDITNYVMLLTGQPLHAFDLDRVAGGRLVVRRAGDGEQVATLDGQTRTLDADVCSSPTPTARRRSPASWAARAPRSQRRHDARADGGRDLGRAEHQPHLVEARPAQRGQRALREGPRARAGARGAGRRHAADARALRRAPRAGHDRRRAARGPRRPRIIRLRDARVARAARRRRSTRWTQRAAPHARSASSVADAHDGLDVTVPHFRRHDVTREADLIEEVARLDGVETAARDAAQPRAARSAADRRPARCAAAPRTCSSAAACTRSSAGASSRPAARPAAAGRRRPAPRHVVLENPMSEDQSVLRTTLLGSLLDAARHNAARGQGDLALFESGAVYRATRRAQLPARAPRARRARARRRLRRQGAPRGRCCAALRVDARVRRATPQPFLHPGRSAARPRRRRAPSAGSARSTRSSRASGTSTAVAAFELDLDAVHRARRAGRRSYADLTTLPALRQDLAVVVDDDVPAATVLDACARRAASCSRAPRSSTSTRRAGRARGAVAGAALTFRAADRTLTDEDVAPVREKIVARLGDELGGELRG